MNYKVTYIWHDCFVTETDVCLFVFDYWKDTDGKIIDIIDTDKPVYIFVSHHHKDHFNSKIFRWASQLSNCHTYIISYDTARFARHLIQPTSSYRRPVVSPSNLHIMHPSETFSDEFITVHALGSTDIGCSYLIDLNGTLLFHAGDLNAWAFADETSADETKQAIDAFKAELSRLLDITKHIDIAMFPIDERLGSSFAIGAKMLLTSLDIRHFIPMHFAHDSESEILQRRIKVACETDKYLPENIDTTVHPLTMPYQSIDLTLWK